MCSILFKSYLRLFGQNSLLTSLVFLFGQNSLLMIFYQRDVLLKSIALTLDCLKDIKKTTGSTKLKEFHGW
jgi:hypothetical protein